MKNRYIIDNIRKIIFVITPKCGVQHINYLYAFLIDKKMTFRQVCNLPSNYKEFIIIFIIRNPYHRIISGFREKYSNDWQKENYLCKYSIPNIKYNKLTFSQFINELHINKLKHIDKHHFIPQTDEFDKIKDCEKLIIYDLYNIDYKYIGELYGKHISEEIKLRRGNHTNKTVWKLNEYVYDKPNLSYRYMKIDNKYFFNDDLHDKMYEFYRQDFEEFKKLGFDYKIN